MSAPKQKLIIQSSPNHTASTLLVNALYGLIPALNAKRIYMDSSKLWKNDLKEGSTAVLKSHNMDFDHLTKHFGKDNDVFFVCSEREEYDAKIHDKYRNWPNVVIFQYEELNETKTNSIENIVDTIYRRVQPVVGCNMNPDTGVIRIQKMNERYEEIKEKPFGYRDPFFEIHGSHRNRKHDVALEYLASMKNVKT